jgi:hypothetical protein
MFMLASTSPFNLASTVPAYFPEDKLGSINTYTNAKKCPVEGNPG